MKCQASFSFKKVIHLKIIKMLSAAVVIDALTLCMLGNFACFFVVCGLFFKLTFQKNLSGIQSECQTIWIQIRHNVLSGLIWVQTVCKGYQQMTKVATSGERVRGQQGILHSSRWGDFGNNLDMFFAHNHNVVGINYHWGKTTVYSQIWLNVFDA